MRIITKREIIKGVLERWKYQYPNENHGKDKLEITKKLSKLNLSRVSAKRVDEIIGNQSWTRLDCDECQEPVDKVVMFIERNEDEYECNTCELCLDCLKKALKLAQKRGKGKQ